MKSNLTKFLVFDVETISAYKRLKDAPDNVQASFDKFCKKRFNKDEPDKSNEELYHEKTALFAEFSDIACISIGRFKPDGSYKVVSLVNTKRNSKEILEKFAEYLNKIENNVILCGYNINNFDIPVIFKQMIKHGIEIPKVLSTYNVKPWERQVFDIFEFWKTQSYMPSLDSVCTFLNIDSPKEFFHADNVTKFYYEDKFQQIADYCEGDVIATMSVLEEISKCIKL